MHKIDLHGNNGECYSKPGKTKKAKCGICGAQMNVERNVLNSTTLKEILLKIKRKYDWFICPYFYENWHRTINDLKTDILGLEDETNDIMKCQSKLKKELGVAPKKWEVRIEFLKGEICCMKETIDYFKKEKNKAKKKIIAILKTHTAR